MKMRSRRCNWFTQWNYFAPFIWIWQFFCNRRRVILKCTATMLAIIIGISLANILSDFCYNAKIYATSCIESFKKNEQDKIDKLLRLKLDKEEAEKRVQEEITRREEQRQFEEQQRIQRLNSEIYELVSVGSYIQITWFRDIGNGPDPPSGCSSVGQIESIEGTYIKGTWGDYVIDYPHDVFHKIRKKEYNDIRKKEDKKLAKKNKKEFKSWGLYPGTT